MPKGLKIPNPVPRNPDETRQMARARYRRAAKQAGYSAEVRLAQVGMTAGRHSPRPQSRASTPPRSRETRSFAAQFMAAALSGIGLVSGRRFA